MLEPVRFFLEQCARGLVFYLFILKLLYYKTVFLYELVQAAVIDKFPYIFKKIVKSFALLKRNLISASPPMKKSFYIDRFHGIFFVKNTCASKIHLRIVRASKKFVK
jgi:hypothetical protein